LNRFENCPLHWWYKKLKRVGIETDDTPRRLGLNIHQMIDEYFKTIPEVPTIDEIEQIAKLVFDKKFDKSLSSVREKAEKCWRNFIKFEKERLKSWPVYKPTKTEAVVQTGDYYCIVDFVSEECGVAIDWKTGAKTRLWDSELRQGKINLMALEGNGSTVDKFFFVCLENGKTLEMPEVNRAWIENSTQRMRRMISKGLFPKIVGKLCGWCEYQLDCEFSGICLWLNY